MKYIVLSLDMWGHVPADCTEDCPCTKECDFCTEGVDDSSWSGPRSRASCTTCGGKGFVHDDDDKCDCHEDCNDQHRVGAIEVADDADDAAIIQALVTDGFLKEIALKQCEIDDYSDGPLDVRDHDGRMIFALQPEEETCSS